MVNTGKPSPGCFACRNRRIKCDTTRPECRKCRKRGWKCPGYRDLNALRIVDETQKQFTRFSGEKDQDDAPAAGSSKNIIIRQYIPPGGRYKSPRTASAAHSYPSPVSQASSPGQPRSPPNLQSQCPDTIPQGIGTPIGDQVYSYFLANFVVGTSLRNHGYLDFLFPLLAKNPPGQRDHPLPLAFSATAMIAFAARQKVPDLLPMAESTYLKALESTFQAIGDPNRACDNSTLACVTLLTTFEQLRPSKPSYRRAEAFGSHLDGAVALLKMRGKDVFQTAVGRKIFIILRSLLVSRSICYATPLEPELYNLTDAFDQDPAQRRFAELSLRAADVRVAIESLLGGWGPSHPAHIEPTREAIESVLREADALEADYAEHFRFLPIAWKGMTVRYMTHTDPTIMAGIPYVGRVDAYIDMFICYILNWARAARLYIRNTAMRCRAWLLGPEQDCCQTPEYAEARRLSEEIIGDIVASVPYVFGAARIGSGQTQAPSMSAGGRFSPPSLAGVFVMWPVFAAASSDYTTDAQRAFLKRTLKYISEEIGIGQAAILAGYNLRTPSMPIAYTRMKQFEKLGKPLHGVASGAAARTTMATGLSDIVRTTGSVISPPIYTTRHMPMRISHQQPELH
ncbi:White-opaque regulator 1 [Cytospora mali]|uniref:White-opaque regulator 1 n=1 Tax=Cytospora mali TaxID=578113 RepID=A0A194W622_CYTMA|nr:White-opaque regulator 1 [Valsa mali]